MRHRTRDIGEGGIDVRVAVTEGWLEAECGDASLGLTRAGLCLAGRLEPAGEGYLLRGTLHGELLVPCARCLELALVTVDSPVAASFVEAAPAEGAEPDESQDDVVAIEHGTIDLSRTIRDEILLAIPMSPVCRPDCAGICPACGRNRNLTPCDCESRASASSKLGALAKMKLQ